MEEVEEITTPYDHTRTSANEACGISNEMLQDAKSLSYELIKQSRRLSELTEKLEQSLSRRELAFIASLQVLETFEKVRIISSLLGNFLKDDNIECRDCKDRDECESRRNPSH